MCSGCLSYQSHDFDDKQFGARNYGSMGDEGVAIKSSTRYDGDNGQNQKFEGTAPAKLDSGAVVQYTGRQ